ncbi:hypothetical protein BDV93DRAFT_556387 [Ceratobasidium sp. AG-I]|nr:hypothetical protein BDV93DRAFT_556387 [Ceratobasidium sp. AG-I]
MSPSGLFHASPIEDVAIQSMYFGPPVGHTVAPSWASASSPQPLPIDVGARPWQGHFVSVKSTSNSSPTHSIGAAMVASASADPGSSDPAKRTIAPRKKGGPKPSNKTCQDCGQTFDRPFLLADHMHVHTGTKNHTCPGCGNSYSTKSNMGRHHRRGKCEG